MYAGTIVNKCDHDHDNTPHGYNHDNAITCLRPFI